MKIILAVAAALIPGGFLVLAIVGLLHMLRRHSLRGFPLGRVQGHCVLNAPATELRCGHCSESKHHCRKGRRRGWRGRWRPARVSLVGQGLTKLAQWAALLLHRQRFAVSLS
jgi:hypothetical protein